MAAEAGGRADCSCCCAAISPAGGCTVSFCRRPTTSFVQSPKMRENIARMGLAKEKMTPVPMGVPPRLLDWPAADRDEVVPGRILYLGTLASSRQLGILVDAFALVRRQFPHASLVFVGEGDFPHERSSLEQLAATPGAGRRSRVHRLRPHGAGVAPGDDRRDMRFPIVPRRTLDVGSPDKARSSTWPWARRWSRTGIPSRRPS